MSAIKPTESASPSRRAMLAGALGGMGAWAAGAFGRANPARAVDPNDVVLGATNTTDEPTTIQSTLGALRPFVTILPAQETGPHGGLGTPKGLLVDATGYQDGVAIHAKSSIGYAVIAEDQFEGFGLFAGSKGGFAIWTTQGRIHFGGHSGTVDIPAGSKTVNIRPSGKVYPSSSVQLTPMVDLGARRYWYTRSTTADTITIHISSPRATRSRFSWFMIE